MGALCFLTNVAGVKSRKTVPLRLHPANLGVSDGAPDVKDELVGEGEISQSLVQSFRKLVRVPLVFAQLHHGGRCGDGEDPFHKPEHKKTQPPRSAQTYRVHCLECPCSSRADRPPSRWLFPQMQKAGGTEAQIPKRIIKQGNTLIRKTTGTTGDLLDAHQLLHCGRTFRAQTKGPPARPQLNP